MAEWNAGTRETPMRIGIGVHRGEVFVGLVGDDDRPEQATKTFRTTKPVSQAALNAARASGAEWPCAEWREVNRRPLRGRQEAFPVYDRAA